MVVGYDLAREALTHPGLLKDATPAAEALAAAGYVLHRPSVGLGAQMTEADPPEHTRLRRSSPSSSASRTAITTTSAAGRDGRSRWPRPSTVRRRPRCTRCRPN
ncbi:hypothetical protein [Streptomyces eurythermus]|uniref:hypothetical protein n=1 Tax=Streptomyces eurythermus TaxID=42237 RepID=UPI003701FAE7